MSQNNGLYFSSKSEALTYVRNEFPNVDYLPDYAIESIIDFSKKFEDTKEYNSVQDKIRRDKPLTAKQKKKYGHLSFEKKLTEYPKGTVLDNHVTISEEYDDLNDPEVFKRYNKYGIERGELNKPDDKLTFQLTDDDNTKYIATAPIDKLQNSETAADSWDVKKIEE